MNKKRLEQAMRFTCRSTLAFAMFCGVFGIHDKAAGVQLRDKGQAAQEMLRQAFQTDAALQGAWVVNWRKNPDAREGAGRYEMDIIVDASKTGRPSQVERIRQLLNRADLDLPFEIGNVYKVSLGDLFHRLEVLIDSTPRLDGCRVVGGYFAAGTEGQQLRLVGRVAEAKQRDLILRLCQNFIDQDPVWNRVSERTNTGFAAWTTELRELAPSVEVGIHLYAEGLSYFWERNYWKAKDAFAAAIVEAPRSYTYRMWRVLCLMTIGDEQKAREFMGSIVSRGMPTHSDRQQLGRSMLKIQGGLRLKLIRLEMTARSDLLAQLRLADQLEPTIGLANGAAPAEEK